MTTCAGEGCGRVAVRECDHAQGMVCGAPLCIGCEHVGGSMLAGGTHMDSVEAVRRAEVRRFERTQAAIHQASQYPLHQAVRFAISDPGAFTPRGDNYRESVESWGARAVLLMLPHHPNARDTLRASTEDGETG